MSNAVPPLTRPGPLAPATELVAALRSGVVRSRDLLEQYLARIAAHNPAINAVVVMDVARARARADALDAALARGEPAGPLHGLPMTVKESFDLGGLPTTWGSPAHRQNIAQESAVAVQRLEDAGAVVFGKTNVPLMLADWQSFNEVYGTTNNPWDPGRSPGGSSGGSAAALAAGMVGLELGSDIGGSLRVPAHYCGVYSHKPTYGIVPALGHGLSREGAPTDISVCGPMARSAADLRLALEVLAGPHPRNAIWQLQLPPPRRTRLADCRVAVLLDHPEAEVDAPVREALRALADFLVQQGAQVQIGAVPAIDMTEVSRDATTLIRGAQGGKVPQAEYERQLAIRAALGPDDDDYAARYARAITATHREWLQAHDRRYDVREKWARFFAQWDVLLCPVTSSVAFPHDQVPPRHLRVVPINGRLRPSIEQAFWAGLAGMAWLPATVAPLAQSPDGLPIGVQIIGPHGGDLGCIRFAELLEAAWRGFRPPPSYVDDTRA